MKKKLPGKLVQSWTLDQKKLAVISDKAPSEIHHRPAQNPSISPQPEFPPPSSRKISKRECCTIYLPLSLIDCGPVYTNSSLHQIDAAGFDKINFAWMGGLDSTDTHFYRINGPTVLIEFVNFQGHATHIHTIWHDPTNDFGRSIVQPNSKQ